MLNEKFIPLHEPRFLGNEKKYLNECIDSTFVSSVGNYVDDFENKIAKYIGQNSQSQRLMVPQHFTHSLMLANLNIDSEVITQPLTFVATCNAISYCNAKPIFIDVDRETMGLSPSAFKIFLENNTTIKNKQCFNNKTNKIIKSMCANAYLWSSL